MIEKEGIFSNKVILSPFWLLCVRLSVSLTGFYMQSEPKQKKTVLIYQQFWRKPGQWINVHCTELLILSAFSCTQITKEALSADSTVITGQRFTTLLDSDCLGEWILKKDCFLWPKKQHQLRLLKDQGPPTTVFLKNSLTLTNIIHEGMSHLGSNLFWLQNSVRSLYIYNDSRGIS